MYRRIDATIIWFGHPQQLGVSSKKKQRYYLFFFDLLFLFSNLSFGQLSKGFNRILPLQLASRSMVFNAIADFDQEDFSMLEHVTGRLKLPKRIEILVGGEGWTGGNFLRNPKTCQDLQDFSKKLNLSEFDQSIFQLNPCLVTQMISTLRLETLNRHLGIWCLRGFSMVDFGELDHPWKLNIEDNWWIFFDFTVFFSGLWNHPGVFCCPLATGHLF